MLERVLIANRGEVAVRLVRACHELGIDTVAVYSTADAESLHVRMADRAVCIGPPAATRSYLNIPSIVAAAQTTGCDAVHPGWGFLAENAVFAQACHDHDLVFVGPRPDSIEVMGDKVRARELMSRYGIPIVPGSTQPVGLAEARRHADELGYPVLLKATAGGGGRGMRTVDAPAALDAAFATASAEAQAAFGTGALYIEKALLDARHIEVQVVGDGRGDVVTLGERDCSIQRRHQKLIEEAPSPAVSAERRQRLEAAAASACDAVSYRGAGTIEFLAPAGGDFYFIEMNTRLQVEHPVTELVTGVDLVHAQLRVAAGEDLPEGGGGLCGHAVEVRINAEDPARDFMPSPGTIERFSPPLGPGVRVDSHVFSGYEVPPFYDSLLAKVIVHAADRPLALARVGRALAELEIVGVPTTRQLARDIVAHPAFAGGDYSTRFLEREAAALPGLSQA